MGRPQRIIHFDNPKSGMVSMGSRASGPFLTHRLLSTSFCYSIPTGSREEGTPMYSFLIVAVVVHLEKSPCNRSPPELKSCRIYSTVEVANTCVGPVRANCNWGCQASILFELPRSLVCLAESQVDRGDVLQYLRQPSSQIPMLYNHSYHAK
jgi:hypothetical protein